MQNLLTDLAARLSGVPQTQIQVSLRPPLAHQSNRLYDVWVGQHHWIAKEFLKPEEFADSPVREYEALKLVAPLDIAPQPVHFEPHTPANAPIVIYEYVDGAMWDRHTPTPAELTQLAELWLTKHTVTRDDLWLSSGYRHPLSEVLARFQDYFQQYAQWAEVHFPQGMRVVPLCLDLLNTRAPIVEALTASQPVLCFCRADPRFANVIRRPDSRLALIDWEDSGLRDPARDLADLITHPNQEDLLTYKEWQPFFSTYLGERSQVDGLTAHRTHLYLALFPLFYLALSMSWGVRMAQENRLARWRINDLPANERLRRYLARSLAWPDMDMRRELDRVADLEFFPTESV